MTRVLIAFLTVFVILAPSLAAQGIPSPQQYFGFDMGSDRRLANWDQLTSYYEELAERSQRVIVDTLGTTTTGQPFVMLTITSPENHERLDELREMQMKLADPRIISSEAELTQLFDGGKAVAMI
ncbi:MAG TPA: peptidase M14, partial [Gemmatimonadetes bacterium]|nr:peptidase M14 [Gemmatimonadota bacterium]